MNLAYRSSNARAVAIVCVALIAPGDGFLSAQAQQPPPMAGGAGQENEGRMAPEQLDSLVAPIALYPDPLLAQVFAASTYPLQIVEAQRWMSSTLRSRTVAHSRRSETGLGPKHPGLGCFPECNPADGSEPPVDHCLGECFSCATRRCNGGGTAHEDES